MIPSAVEEGVAVDGPAGVFVQQLEHGGFARREVDGVGATGGAEFVRPHRQVQHHKCGAGIAADRHASAQSGPDAGEEFPFAEGFPDEVIRPEFEPHHDVDLLVFCGEKKDRHRGIGSADAAADSEAVKEAFSASLERLALVFYRAILGGQGAERKLRKRSGSAARSVGESEGAADYL